jgi:hypothetical protein
MQRWLEVAPPLTNRQRRADLVLAEVFAARRVGEKPHRTSSYRRATNA